MPSEICEKPSNWRGVRTENAGHDGDAGILDLALGVVDAQGLQRWKTNCFVSAGHFEGSYGGLD